MKNRICIAFLIIVGFAFSITPSVYASQGKQAELTKNETSSKQIEESKKENNGSITLEASYGIQGVGKVGKYIPVQIKIANQGNRFQGKLKLMMNTTEDSNHSGRAVLFQYSDTKNYMFEKEITAENGQTVVDFSVPSYRNITKFHILLENSNGVVADTILDVNMGDTYSQLFIGVLSDKADQLSYLDGMSLYKYAEFTTQVLNLDELSFPSEAFALESMDMLLIDDFNSDRLSNQQYDALKEWVGDGGILILAGGAQADSVFRLFHNKDMLDVRIGKTQPLVLNLHELGSQFDSNQFNTVSMNNTNLTIGNAKMLYQYKNIPILQKVTYGKGAVIVSGIDFAENSLSELSYFNVQAAVEIINKIYGEKRLQSMENQQLYDEKTNYWSVSAVLNSVVMKEIPSFYKYGLILFIYVCLTGPALYIILKRFDKRNLFWAAEVVLALTFSSIIIFTSSSSRITEPFLNYFEIQTLEPNRREDSVYFNIRAPYNRPYEIALDNQYQIKPITGYYYYEEDKKQYNLDDYNVGITFGKDNNILRIKDIAAFSKEYFLAEKEEKQAGTNGVEIQCNLYGSKLEGTLTNHLDYDLENATILLYNKMITLNSVKKGETIDLAKYAVKNYSVRYLYGLTNQIAGLKTSNTGVIQENDFQENEKKLILDFYLQSYHPLNEDSAVLIAFSPKKDTFSLQKDSAYQSYGMTLLEVPITMSYVKEGLVYQPTVSVLQNDYGTYSDLMVTNEVEHTYQFGNNKEIEKVLFEPIEYYDNSYYNLFDGKISFYNLKTNAYDQMDPTRRSFDKTLLKPYLNAKNELIVKYEAKLPENYKETILPIVTTVGRDKSAEN